MSRARKPELLPGAWCLARTEADLKRKNDLIFHVYFLLFILTTIKVLPFGFRKNGKCSWNIIVNFT